MTFQDLEIKSYEIEFRNELYKNHRIDTIDYWDIVHMNCILDTFISTNKKYAAKTGYMAYLEIFKNDICQVEYNDTVNKHQPYHDKGKLSKMRDFLFECYVGEDTRLKPFHQRLFNALENQPSRRDYHGYEGTASYQLDYDLFIKHAESLALDDIDEHIVISDKGIYLVAEENHYELLTYDNSEIDDIELMTNDEGYIVDINSDYSFYCENCDNPYLDSVTNSYLAMDSSDSEILICNSCRDREYVYVENDSRYIHADNENLYFDNTSRDYLYFPDDASLSEYCIDNNLELDGNKLRKREKTIDDFDPYKIYSYGTDIPTGDLKDDVLYFGTELELEIEDEDGDEDDVSSCHEDFVRDYKRHNPVDFICCEDGSLGEGFEVISVPYEYKEQREYLERLARALKGNGLTSYDRTNCGFHVHVSRNALECNVRRFIWLFLNSYDNIKWLQRIGNRVFNSYCESNKLVNMQELEKSRLDDKYESLFSNDRYTVINYQNKNTIEFRFFKGTYKVEALHSYLEFIIALIDYAKQETEKEVMDLRVENLLQWMQEEEERAYKYSNLLERLDKHLVNERLKLNNQLQLELVH